VVWRYPEEGKLNPIIKNIHPWEYKAGMDEAADFRNCLKESEQIIVNDEIVLRVGRSVEVQCGGGIRVGDVPESTIG